MKRFFLPTLFLSFFSSLAWGERPNILFDSAGQMTHLVLAADLVTGDEGCAAHGRCRRGEKPPCATACTNCKYTDHAGTIVVALKSDDTTPAAAAQEDGWTLAWSDDFNGTVRAGSKWTVSDNFTHSDYTYKLARARSCSSTSSLPCGWRGARCG